MDKNSFMGILEKMGEEEPLHSSPPYLLTCAVHHK
jgi:hypothetical protein